MSTLSVSNCLSKGTTPGAPASPTELNALCALYGVRRRKYFMTPRIGPYRDKPQIRFSVHKIGFPSMLVADMPGSASIDEWITKVIDGINRLA